MDNKPSVKLHFIKKNSTKSQMRLLQANCVKCSLEKSFNQLEKLYSNVRAKFFTDA